MKPIPNTRVLIADDVPQARRLLASYLVDLGYRNIDMVGTGEEVLAAYRLKAYDLAFIDIEMPNLDGLQVLPQILELAPATHVVMVTTQGTVDNVMTAVESGARGFLVKPYTKQKLAESVMRLPAR